jgi:hypothetical protein
MGRFADEAVEDMYADRFGHPRLMWLFTHTFIESNSIKV